LLFRAYRSLDDRLFRVSPDAFQEVSIEPLLTACGRVELSITDTEPIRNYDLDVVIRLGDPKNQGLVPLAGLTWPIATYGIWCLGHAGDGPAGFWEVLEGQATTSSVLRILGQERQNPKIIYRTQAMTDPRSMKVNRSNAYWKSSRFISRKLKELR